MPSGFSSIDERNKFFDSQAKEKKRETNMALSMMGGALAFTLIVTAILLSVSHHWGIERETPAARDVLLVSFPKSGSNWLRFILVGLFVKDSTKKPLNFRVVEKLVPDLEFGPARNQFQKGSKIAWKSHQPYRDEAYGAAEKPKPCNMSNMEGYQCLCPNCPKRWSRIVYLVRDGRSALCSYYVMQTQLGNFDSTFEEFLASPKSTYGLPWPLHVESYLGRDNVFFLKYEDLLENSPLKTLQDLAIFLGHAPLSDAESHAVLQASNFDNMRKTELKDGTPLFDENYPGARATGGFRLVREGKADGWKSCTEDPHIFDKYIPNFSRTMAKLGYSDDSSS